jgi:hypothetical protein
MTLAEEFRTRNFGKLTPSRQSSAMSVVDVNFSRYLWTMVSYMPPLFSHPFDFFR